VCWHYLSRQEDLATRSLVNGNGGDLAGDLDLHAVAVDNLSHGDGILKDKPGFLAGIKHDRIDFALDLDNRVVALVDVDGLPCLGIFNHNVLVVGLVFLHKTKWVRLPLFLFKEYAERTIFHFWPSSSNLGGPSLGAVLVLRAGAEAAGVGTGAALLSWFLVFISFVTCFRPK